MVKQIELQSEFSPIIKIHMLRLPIIECKRNESLAKGYEYYEALNNN